MKRYIKKYSLLLIILVGFQGLLKVFIVSQLPIVLIKSGIEFNNATFLTNTFLINIPYLTNIIIAIFILIDLLRLKIKSIPIVLLSIFSYFAGIILFLFLINNKIERNEQ